MSRPGQGKRLGKSTDRRWLGLNQKSWLQYSKQNRGLVQYFGFVRSFAYLCIFSIYTESFIWATQIVVWIFSTGFISFSPRFWPLSATHFPLLNNTSWRLFTSSSLRSLPRAKTGATWISVLIEWRQHYSHCTTCLASVLYF